MGGVKSLEQTNNRKIEDILGYKDIQQKYENLRQGVSTQLVEEQNKIQNELNNFKNNQNDRVTKDQPSVDYFNSFTDKLKT